MVVHSHKGIGAPTRLVSHILFLAALVLPTTASSQSGDFRCPAAKTLLMYSDGGQIESLGQAGDHVCRFKNATTYKTYERLLGAFDPTAAVTKDNIAKIRSLNPLQVGKTVTYEYSGASNVGSDGAWTYTVSIERYETVKTPAGTMPCFVILQVERTFQGIGRWERRWWYSPVVGHVVKFEFKTIHGNPPPSNPKNWELVEIKTL